MEVDWLGGEYRLQKAVVLGELGEERNIGVVANGEDISLRWMRRLLPESGVPGGDLAADDGLAAIGAAVEKRAMDVLGWVDWASAAVRPLSRSVPPRRLLERTKSSPCRIDSRVAATGCGRKVVTF